MSPGQMVRVPYPLTTLFTEHQSTQSILQGPDKVRYNMVGVPEMRSGTGSQIKQIEPMIRNQNNITSKSMQFFPFLVVPFC